MKLKTLARMVVLSAGLVLAASFAHAAETAQHVPLAKTIGKPVSQAPVPSLGVINAKNATLADGKLVLDGIAGNRGRCIQMNLRSGAKVQQSLPRRPSR